jgi:hypothetical protein
MKKKAIRVACLVVLGLFFSGLTLFAVSACFAGGENPPAKKVPANIERSLEETRLCLLNRDYLVALEKLRDMGMFLDQENIKYPYELIVYLRVGLLQAIFKNHERFLAAIGENNQESSKESSVLVILYTKIYFELVLSNETKETALENEILGLEGEVFELLAKVFDCLPETETRATKNEFQCAENMTKKAEELLVKEIRLLDNPPFKKEISKGSPGKKGGAKKPGLKKRGVKPPILEAMKPVKT